MKAIRRIWKIHPIETPLKTSAAFFSTVGGHPEEYEFLLASIDHHAGMGPHLVLDTSVPEIARQFVNLPKSVRWVHEPIYGHGRAKYRMRSAIRRATELAREFGTDILVYTDADEFWSGDSPLALFPKARDAMVHVRMAHWTLEGWATVEPHAHKRLWPASWEVTFGPWQEWVNSPEFSGNEEDHVITHPPAGKPVIGENGIFRHHLRCALGQKSNMAPPIFSEKIESAPWPTRAALWRDTGALPSADFTEKIPQWTYAAGGSYPFGDEITYRKAAAFLDGACDTVEEWGCGPGWASRFFTKSKYVGVDATKTPAVHVVEDVTTRLTSVDGILIRHVLEHNVGWPKILENAMRSFKKRMALVIFTPYSRSTGILHWHPQFRVPDISFRKSDLTRYFVGSWEEEGMKTTTQYGYETVFYLKKG